MRTSKIDTMRGRLRWFLFGCVVPVLSAGRADAQSCCGKLDVPLAGTERVGNRDGQLLAGLSYELALSHDGFTEQGYGIVRAQTHTLTLDASYGVTNWLTPGVALPLLYKHYAALVSGDSVPRHTLGVGDTLVLVKLTLVGASALAPGALRIWLAPGLKLPTGAYQQDDAYGRLPAAAQPGSGSFDGVAAAFAAVGLDGEPGKTLLIMSIVARLTTENPEGFRAGHSFDGTLYLSLSQIERIGLRFGPQLRFGMRDRQARMPLANTGALRVLGRGGAAFSVDDAWSITADVQVPIYARVHGDQLDPLFAATLGLLLSYP
jgi:hypothetical protein